MLCNRSELLFTHLMKVTKLSFEWQIQETLSPLLLVFHKILPFSLLWLPGHPVLAQFSLRPLFVSFSGSPFPAHSLHVFVIWSYKGLISQYPWGIPLSLMFLLLLTRKCFPHLHLQALPHVTPDSHVRLPTGHHHKHSWHKAEYILSPTLLPVSLEQVSN